MPLGMIVVIVTQIVWGVGGALLAYRLGPGKGSFKDLHPFRFLKIALILAILVPFMMGSQALLFSLLRIDPTVLADAPAWVYSAAAFATLFFLNRTKPRKRWRKKASDAIKKLVARVEEAARGLVPVPIPQAQPAPVRR